MKNFENNAFPQKKKKCAYKIDYHYLKFSKLVPKIFFVPSGIDCKTMIIEKINSSQYSPHILGLCPSFMFFINLNSLIKRYR